MTRLADIEVDPAIRQLAAAGDAAAQTTVYERLSPPVFALVRRLIIDRAAAEDVFQDSLMAVFENLSQFRGDAPFGAWVRQIVTSRCFMHLRSPWQRARYALADFGSEEQWAVALRLRAELVPDLAAQVDLSRALLKLAPLTRAIVWLHDVEGLTHEEIAQGFGRSVSFSKSQLSRGHQSLKALLQQSEESACRNLTVELKGVS